MASGVYTLPTPTANVWNRLQLPPDSVAIMFKNDSTFDFLLVFGGTVAPSFLTSPGGQANAMVNALEYPVIYTQRRGASDYEQRLNSVGAWDGNLWYMAQDNTGGLATTGTISGRTVLTVMAYGPNDPVPPSGQAVTRQVDITSQPRIISLPMTPAACYTWSSTVTAGNDYQPFPATVAVTSPAFDTGCVVYCYGACATPGTTVGQCAFAFQLLFRDYNVPGTILSRVDFLYGHAGLTATAGEQFNFMPAFPFSIICRRGATMPANAGIVEINLHDYGGTAAWALLATVLLDSDKLTPGQVTIPGIGQGLNPTQYSGGVPKF